jgi:replicative DNA helicase
VKLLAAELGLPILVLSQLNRAIEVRHSKVPKLSDLRDTGALEQDAAVVMVLQRPTPPGEGEEKEVEPTDLYILKQRNGPTGKVSLMFHRAYTAFYDKAPEGEEASDAECPF